MGKDELSVMMELRSTNDGFAGIPQETRLIFAALAGMPNVQLTGLLQHGSTELTSGIVDNRRYSEEKRLGILSRHVISYADPAPGRLHVMRHINALLRGKDSLALHGKLLASSNLGTMLPLTSFDAETFKDFIWTRFFAKSLPASDMAKVITAQFKVLTPPYNAMHRIGRIPFNRSRYPKIDTRGYDFLLAQTPFPGRVRQGTKLVVRYHDAIPIFLPHTIHSARSHWGVHFAALRSNARDAFFACTSQTTRLDLLRLHPQLEHRSRVIHDIVSPEYFVEATTREHIAEIIQTRLDIHTYKMGDKPLLASGKHDAAAAGDAQPSATSGRRIRAIATSSAKKFHYILMVSTIEPRKNHRALISAWESIRARTERNLKLVIVGTLGWDHDAIIKAMRRWQERGEIFHLSSVPAEELRLLYNGAELVVCPSFSEGFDCSGVEAMLCGTPVAASDIPVHTEVYGTCAKYFNPYSFSELADALTELLSHYGTSKRSKLAEQGLKFAQRYTRSAIAPQWLDYFESLRAQPARQTSEELGLPMQPVAIKAT